MPDTSRKLEYTADISVRSEGLTAIKNGSPAEVSSSTKNTVPAIKAATVIQGQGAASVAIKKQTLPPRQPTRIAMRTERLRIQRSISGARNKPKLAIELATPPTWSPRPFSTAKMPTYTKYNHQAQERIAGINQPVTMRGCAKKRCTMASGCARRGARPDAKGAAA